MRNNIIILVFNILYGLMSGFITNRVFNDRDWNRRNWYYIINKDDARMIICIAIASTLIGMFFYYILPKDTLKWGTKGILFGSFVPFLAAALLYFVGLYDTLTRYANPELVLDTKLKFIAEFYRSFRFVELFIFSLFSSLYGWVFLLVPALGLGWAYVLYHYVIPCTELSDLPHF